MQKYILRFFFTTTSNNHEGLMIFRCCLFTDKLLSCFHENAITIGNQPSKAKYQMISTQKLSGALLFLRKPM